MKYFVSTAIALALMGAATASFADPQSDKAAAEAHDRAQARDRQQMQDRDHANARDRQNQLDRDHMNARDRQNQIDRDNANARDRQNQLDRDHMNARDRQNQLDRDHMMARDRQNEVDRAHAQARDNQRYQGRPGYGFQGHGMRPNDNGRGYYDPGRFGQRYYAQHRFRYEGPGYPRGWYEHSWRYGEILPFGWFTPDYYLNYDEFGLQPPPIGCEWVRQGGDAVLVDVWTGQVLSVYQGVFY